jgi:cytochrome c-type biogenesis protein CcmF
MDLAQFSNPIILLTFLIDALFGFLAIILVKKIFAKQNTHLRAPFYICAFAIGVLLFFYLTSTTTIANVWLNSNVHTPLLYKIAGVWGNHEGSMLLFFTFLTAWATLLRNNEAIRLAAFVLLVIGGYVYLCANPFAILAIKAAAGQDLNPALQNPYLAIHPPILYAGQTLCFVLWIWACVAPNHPRIPFYTRVCFGLITLGLILGARWAYGELGWGGFWFWDPVETVSLFPWLAIAAAVHTTNGRTCLLIAFPMVMLGLTLVRSGVLVSVHSFGFDPYNGIWLGLCTLAVSAISVMMSFSGSNAELRHPEPCKGVGIQSYKFRSLIPIGFLCILAALCALILVPVMAKIFLAQDISIDETFFHNYINPCLLGLLVFTSFAPYMKTHWWSLLCAALCTIIWCLTVHPHSNMLATCAALVGFWVGLSTLNHVKQIFSKGFVAAHLGVGLCILGASHAEIFTEKQEFSIADLPPKFASNSIQYISKTVDETPQVTKEILTFSVNGNSLAPERQHFHISRVTKHQPAWVRVNLDHIHATAFIDGSTWKIELMHKPLISIFWLGLLFVLMGILVSVRQFQANINRTILTKFKLFKMLKCYEKCCYSWQKDNP